MMFNLLKTTPVRIITKAPTFDDTWTYTAVAPGLEVGESCRTAVGASGDIRRLKFTGFE